MPIVGLIIGTFMVLGPVMAFIGLLNWRERRESALHTSVLKQFATREIRGRIAIQVRCGLFSRPGIVTVDMWTCSRDEVWDAITRLGRHLPPGARLVVNGSVDPQFPARFTVETEVRASLCRRYRTSTVTP